MTIDYNSPKFSQQYRHITNSAKREAYAFILRHLSESGVIARTRPTNDGRYASMLFSMDNKADCLVWITPFGIDADMITSDLNYLIYLSAEKFKPAPSFDNLADSAKVEIMKLLADVYFVVEIMQVESYNEHGAYHLVVHINGKRRLVYYAPLCEYEPQQMQNNLEMASAYIDHCVRAHNEKWSRR